MLKQKNKSGFTLVELIISIGIFVMFLGIVSTSYVSIVRAQRNANEVRKMYSEVRDFIQLFTQEVRLGSIYFDCYPKSEILQNPQQIIGSTLSECEQPVGYLDNATGATDTLVLVRKDGLQKQWIRFNADKKMIEILKYENKNGVWSPTVAFADLQFQPLFSDNLQVTNLTFYLYPHVDPYGNDQAVVNDNSKQFQPKVEMVLSIKNAAAIQSNFSLDFQTTVSSRVYSSK